MTGFNRRVRTMGLWSVGRSSHGSLDKDVPRTSGLRGRSFKSLRERLVVPTESG